MKDGEVARMAVAIAANAEAETAATLVFSTYPLVLSDEEDYEEEDDGIEIEGNVECGPNGSHEVLDELIISMDAIETST